MIYKIIMHFMFLKPFNFTLIIFKIPTTTLKESILIQNFFFREIFLFVFKKSKKNQGLL